MAELTQVGTVDVEVVVDPLLGYEIRDAFRLGDYLVVATWRADGFVEAVAFNLADISLTVGGPDSPFYLYELGGELRARYESRGA